MVSLTINLYSIAFDERQLDKIGNNTALNTTPINIAPTSKIDLLAPVFEIDMDNTYKTANYLYCSELDRYYFIDDIRVNTAQRLELVCRIDVRQSFSDTIKNTECVVLRAESLGAPTQIIDEKLPINPAKKIITSILLNETSNSFNTNAEYSYLLTVIGGTPSV